MRIEVAGAGADAAPRAVEAHAVEALLEALRRAGCAVEAPCGGAGVCGKCAVEVRTMAGGAWQRVLACQTEAVPGMAVRLIAPSAAADVRVEVDAAGVPYERFARDAAAPGELGVAVDLGTTTMACYLFDLASGTLLARGGLANPQAPYGADVISRIHACSQGALAELQQRAAHGIAAEAARLCAEAGVDAQRITRWAVAGNTVMEHILCGISPEGIGVYPFEPATLFGDVRAVDGLAERVYLAPCISGYVGGDIAAGLVACGIDEAPRDAVILFADLGTNGEMALLARGELRCCATATGPAFEGATISQGMQARAGAIDACAFEDGAFRITTVDDALARGICGSGLIDALAACLAAGVVDETGRILAPDELPPSRAALVTTRDGQPAVDLTGDGAVLLTQKDVRALQLAKASIAAGIETLVDAAGVRLADIDAFLVGGAFGTHAHPAAAAAIGLVPSALLPVVRMVGNCAGAGACAALLSAEARSRLAAAAHDARYIELSLDAGFAERYLDAMEFEGEDA